MNEFNGFPTKNVRFTPIPNVVFSTLFPQITDITELKVLFHIFETIYPKKGSLQFTSFNELLGQAGLMASLKVSPQETLNKALDSLAGRGVILRLDMNRGESEENLYFLNTEANKLAVERIRNGELVLPGLKMGRPVAANPEGPLDSFTLYEQNIGMLTPLIADELREAEKQYPAAWIKDAIKEAVTQNKRNWRFIAWMLEHWSTEGKDDGTYRGNPKKNTDPDKYIRGKYGHMVQR